jgi:hypothetical protein
MRSAERKFPAPHFSFSASPPPNIDEVVKSVKSRLCERSEAISQFIPV